MTQHRLRWLTDKLGCYALTLVWEFYLTYAATILHDISKEKKHLEQSRLGEVLLRGQWVDISEDMTCQVLLALSTELQIQ